MTVFFSHCPFLRILQSQLWPILILVSLWSSVLHAQQAPSLPRDLNYLVTHKAFAFDPPTGTRADLSGIARDDTLEAIRTFSGHEGAVNTVGFSPDGTRIITGSEDQTVREWDIDTGEGHAPFEGHGGAVQAAFYAPDGAIWSAATDSKVIIRTSDGNVFWEGVFPRPVYSLKLSRDASKMMVGTGTYLLAWPPRPSVYFYDLEAGGPPVHVLGVTSGAGYYVAADYSPTEDKIVTGFLGFLFGDAILWDAVTGTSLYKLGYSNIRDAVFSPDGTQVLTASDDEANLWDVETGTLIRTFTGHTLDVNAVAFFPDGKVVVTGSSDQTARIWNTATGELLQTMVGHTAEVNDVAFSRDGMFLLTAASDSTARLWTPDLGDVEIAPITPTGFAAVSGDSEVTLSWNPNSEDDITQYRLYRDTTLGPTIPAATIPADTETFTDTGLVNGTVYYYRLTAVNAAGVESGFSEEVNATPNDSFEVPIDAIMGTVFDLQLLDSGRLDQNPLDSATVELFANSVLVQSLTTTTSGVFEFSGLESENISYNVHVRAIGRVPETGEEIEVNMTIGDVRAGNYYEIISPRTLASQKLSLVYELEHLKIKSDLLFGLVPPLPLSRSYNESYAKALIATWLADIGDNSEVINTSLARLTLAELVLVSMYDNAAKMSHETGEALLELVIGFHSTFEVYNLIVKALDESEIPKFLYQKLAEQIANLYVDLFLVRPISLLESRLPERVGLAAASGLRAMNAAATSNTTERGASFIVSIVEDQLKNLIVTQMDNVLLSYYYVQPRTQEYLDQAVANAESFNYAGEHITAYAASQTVVNQTTFETGVVHARSEALQGIGTVSRRLGDISALTSAILGPQLLLPLAAILKSIEFSTLLTAAGITASRLYVIQEDEVALGMRLAFDPAASKVLAAQGIDSTLAFAKRSDNVGLYQVKLLDIIEDYIQLLNDIIELARSGEHEEAISKIDELLQVDDELASALLIAEAPVYAAAEQAIQQIEGFVDADIRLNSALTATTTERILLYTRLLEYAVAPSNKVDSLTAQSEITTQALENAVNAITEIDDMISDVAAPPLLVVIKKDIINTGQGVVLRATIKNIGALTAENIAVVLTPDSSSTLLTEPQISIVGLEADAEQIVDWELQITDSTRTFGTYVIEIASRNAKSLSVSGIYSIALVGVSTTTDDRIAQIPSDFTLEQNYPNPFSISTRIAYTLPEARPVTLTIYDALGRAVRVLVDELKSAGHHTVTFVGEGWQSGLYFYTLQAGSFNKTRSMILLR